MHKPPRFNRTHLLQVIPGCPLPSKMYANFAQTNLDFFGAARRVAIVLNILGLPASPQMLEMILDAGPALLVGPKLVRPSLSSRLVLCLAYL